MPGMHRGQVMPCAGLSRPPASADGPLTRPADLPTFSVQLGTGRARERNTLAGRAPCPCNQTARGSAPHFRPLIRFATAISLSLHVAVLGDTTTHPRSCTLIDARDLLPHSPVASGGLGYWTICNLAKKRVMRLFVSVLVGLQFADTRRFYFHMPTEGGTCFLDSWTA
jgi:hypothetical protein